MNKKRLFYLDAARGLAILLVALGHIWETDRPIPVLIYSFHVPLFFIISGILTARTRQELRPLRQLVLARLRTLIVPYLFFELVFVVLSGLQNGFDLSSRGTHFYSGLLLQPMNVPLWFLPTLFLAELLLLLLLRITGSKSAALAICFVLYLIPFFPQAAQLLPDAAARCLCSVGFLALGYLLCGAVQTLDPPLLLLLPAAAAGGFLALQNGKVGIYRLTFHNPVLFTVCAAAGSLCVIFLLKKRRCALLELIGQNSLAILGLHIFALRVIQKIPGLDTDTLPGGLAALAGICLLLAPVCFILNRFFPFLVGKRRR